MLTKGLRMEPVNVFVAESAWVPLPVCLASAASAQKLSCEEHGALLNEISRSIALFLQSFWKDENFLSSK